MTNPQSAGGFSPQLTRDHDEAFFRNYHRANDGYEAPRGYHNIANYVGHYISNSGYQNMQQNNHGQAYGQFVLANANTEKMINQIADIIKNQFGLKLKEPNYMYRHHMQSCLIE